MANKMLIDASHPEETRVVVVRGSRVEEFDFESEHKKQLKGNIYLAKVTRVEPSLQAAFVEYGGNRHGFLAFSEIHPDYYQIPKADREALLAEEMGHADDDDEADEPKPKRSSRAKKGSSRRKAAAREDEDVVSETVEAENEEGQSADESNGDVAASDSAQSDDSGDRSDAVTAADENDSSDKAADDDQDGDEASGDTSSGRGRRTRRSRKTRARSSQDDSDDSNGDDDNGDEAEEIDEIGSEDAMEEVPVRQNRPRRQYKIQEVIKRRQILLVQVVKEERGNKGAALTTYLSLAGRYSVLMPNTARGGGISRKITNAADRKRLKEVVRDLDVPKGMGIILRTAGANRTKAEVKRDYEYLMRLWETVRTVTLSSIAPALVYEEGSLIKRSIRDLYNKDIDQILVAGEAGYREAKDFMRMLMPSQAKVVQPYRDPTPIFARQGIEAQLDKMLQPHVTLKSGGYIIINQTEALVAIDVNSGRSTREHSIEDTAFQTNLEAAEEVARQLRLRDLAGLIVIDFIDMEEKRNNRAVEKKLKDCLKNDRARIQVGKISHFGLLEMSRQRIRASVLESTMQACPVCEGAGHIRSASSLALHVLRSIEEHLQKHSNHDLIVKVPTATALYVLNEKRRRIEELEQLYGLKIVIEADENGGHQAINIEHGAEALQPMIVQEAAHPESVVADEGATDEVGSDVVADASAGDDESDDRQSDGNENGKRRRRRRKKRRGDRGDSQEASAEGQQTSDNASSDDEDSDDSDSGDDDNSDSDNGGRGSRRRRRGRRGGRRHRTENGDGSDNRDGESDDAVAASGDQTTEGEASDNSDHDGGEASVPAPSAGEPETVNADSQPGEVVEVEASTSGAEPETVSEPVREMPPLIEAESMDPADSGAPVEEVETTSAPIDGHAGVEDDAAASGQPAANDDQPEAETKTEPVVTSSAEEQGEPASKPRRTGWWARRSFF
ncbi:ribonuclease E/G [Jiella marina]|uniref:ribonuclease E/G n=1 Tax=Jiella sp. LLJ827 TaxID=2917712 RepID=UPI002100F76E|nr:ribonuclease E/G [Jiella sp. LLJ827]MCQ0986180.1 Rne/Rng family ribonuclease [Jiella sp. LLJ827]